jgi:hypothetical protein
MSLLPVAALFLTAYVVYTRCRVFRPGWELRAELVALVVSLAVFLVSSMGIYRSAG